jgi:RNA polymerase sigma factor (sigma-70 family)
MAQRARSDRAFEKLYQRHVGDVYRYALVVMRNRDDAEDVTQTTFMNAYRAFARGERPRTPQNWLITIAHNVCRQRFRQLQRQPNQLPLEEDEIAQLAPDDDGPTAEDIRRALSHLAFNQRAALVMRELEGRSYAEIAAVLQVSTSAVETLIFRARRALREQLEGGLTCREAEFAVSRQLDGRLSRKDKGALRAHLRECEDCARFARSQRAQRAAIRSLALIPLPASLTSFFHHSSGAAAGTGAAAGGGLAVKAALVGATAVVATGGVVEAVHKTGFHPLRRHEPAAAQAAHAPRAAAAVAVGPRVVSASPAAPARPVHTAAKPKHKLHGRLAVEQSTTKLHGRLREEQRSPDETQATALPPGQLKKLTGTKPVHPSKPTHPTRPTHPSHPAKQAHKTTTPPKPKKHEQTSSQPAHGPKPKDQTATTPAPPSPQPPPHKK